jgi:predicted nucleotidyltransferase component of viral defense system
MRETFYHRQAKLLLQVLPLIERYPVFALKGGTAINFFLRDMPRLSVDIDLTYTVVDDRATALAAIDCALVGLKADTERFIARSAVATKKVQGNAVALMVKSDGVLVKVEPNLVLRGTLFEPERLSLKKGVEDLFGLSVRVRTLATAEIYGGKICAALDRQHPRDLFDIKLLLENEGMTDATRKSFIVHLVSHDRPMAELLDPNFADLKKTFAADFEGMTFVKVSREDLEEARAKLVKAIREDLTDKERQFILSIKKGDPDWTLIGLEGVDRLPAIQWKLLNIEKMDKTKHRQALRKLEEFLGQ